ncbi:MAG: 4-hydroxy-3-methylbut-2-enyl diphosphate reductase [Elusimicrobiaceae bacterium]|jgi:(E)-4-hydroxy-3-methyl-but-2-enyl pyrophosphate reductase|nr:4-hydroxy-3-methylbut-2-enyl diphosphate reductase [Elusimicrobiaceae bacterium]MBT3954700.1 4-hydroxy-3-methylbut-2-enyl diphosphate reductase [Elusimicrobiaceae bacterium]MBT4008038.1 4-hydroxy-3-methylbut-2-enyl diphosphate reductase [Elusimicrobiaceae bacterium]MBT4402597.1 4-hydroxy-3-methylbut-2-enyl diphosphate reductase [Elusimicrobiaceae bacterium]MBT4439352.1 4-hydroxy-3-methylbut-2-enyl diphosphate reductase [Elusimicrobiaceae bacterium]
MAKEKFNIEIAKHGCFCPGVQSAIDIVIKLQKESKKPIFTIGPLIHNKHVTDELEKKGIHTINNLKEVKGKDAVLIIRAHGVTPQFFKQIEDTDNEVVDATCPLVKVAQKKIEQYAKKGYSTVIVGDEGHAEVIGLLGYAKEKGFVVANEKEAKKLPHFDEVNVVSQTTQKEEIFYKVSEIIKKNSKKCVIANTICQPTKERQKETVAFAKKSDLVIVVGGKHSANTARLANLCEELTKNVIHIESAKELSAKQVLPSENIFITAGTSTPRWLVEEVRDRVNLLKSKKGK